MAGCWGKGKAVKQTEFRAALKEVTRAVERYARRSGVTLQPDQAQRRYVLSGLAGNLLRYGRPYCPCREVTGDPAEDRRNTCPCRTHREEIARLGQCECGLYVAGPTQDSVTDKE